MFVFRLQMTSGNREFLDSTSTAKIPAGASIEVAVLDGNGMPLMMQDADGVMKPVFDFGARAQEGKVLIADTEGVTYPDLATTPNYGLSVDPLAIYVAGDRRLDRGHCRGDRQHVYDPKCRCGGKNPLDVDL